MAPPSKPTNISLFNDPTLSDVKIRQIYKGGAKEYFAHKAVLCAHSKWFLKAFTGNFKEASEQTIEVLHDDPKNFEHMLKFMYTMELPSSSTTHQPNIENIVSHDILVPIGVYILADKYEIAPLLLRTCNQVEAAMCTHGQLLSADHIAGMIAAYYGSCPRAQSTMGIVMAKGIEKHAGPWIHRSRMYSNTTFCSTIEAYSVFTVDLMLALRAAGCLDRGR